MENKTKKGIIYYGYHFTGISDYIFKSNPDSYKILTEDHEAYGAPVRNLEELKQAIKGIPNNTKVIIDNLTSLQPIIKTLAEDLFSKSPEGASWKDIQKAQYLDILNIPKGVGYGYYRKAFEYIINSIFSKASEVIIACYIKEKQPEGNEVFRKYIQYEPDLISGCLDILLRKCHTVMFVKQIKEEPGLLGVLNHYEGYLAGSDLNPDRNNVYLHIPKP